MNCRGCRQRFLPLPDLSRKIEGDSVRRVQMNTTLHQNRPEDTRNWTNLCLEPYDYWSHYVNIDLRHQYGISVAESQTFILAKRPQRRRARRNGCFRRLRESMMLSLFNDLRLNSTISCSFYAKLNT